MAAADCNLCSRTFTKRNGRQLTCDVCRADGTLAAHLAQKHREWRVANRVANLAQRKEYRARNGDRIALERREWYVRNREHALQYARDYAERNPTQRKEWMDRNRDSVRQWTHRRRARLVDNGVYVVSPSDLAKLLRRSGGACVYCSLMLTPKTVTWDHVVPISRGGAHSVGNLAPACKPCNSSKRDSTVTEWRKVKA